MPGCPMVCFLPCLLASLLAWFYSLRATQRVELLVFLFVSLFCPVMSCWCFCAVFARSCFTPCVNVAFCFLRSCGCGSNKSVTKMAYLGWKPGPLNRRFPGGRILTHPGAPRTRCCGSLRSSTSMSRLAERRNGFARLTTWPRRKGKAYDKIWVPQ